VRQALGAGESLLTNLEGRRNGGAAGRGIDCHDAPFDERAASFAHGSGAVPRRGTVRPAGPPLFSRIGDDGLADGSWSRCSVRPLHAGRRGGGGRWWSIWGVGVTAAR